MKNFNPKRKIYIIEKKHAEQEHHDYLLRDIRRRRKITRLLFVKC